MKRLFLSTLLIAFAVMLTYAQKKTETVWTDVVMASDSRTLKVNKVTMYEDRTELDVHVDYWAGEWIRLAKGTYLQTGDGKRYMVRDASVIGLDNKYTLPTNEVDFVITFEPVPTGTKRMDMIEPDGWELYNIRNAYDIPDGIADTYWRNVETGEWLIGFAPGYVVYDNKVWEIASQSEKKDTYIITLGNGETVKVGKVKKGQRTIAIGNRKSTICSPINTQTMPDYPTKDTRTGFADNGYRAGDSVTITGWLKDMPERIRKKRGNFTVFCENVLSNNEEEYSAELDSLGRFTLKIPLMNSSEVFIDWGRYYINTFLEPGETYFLLYDFKTGQKLWMGTDVRAQNEMLTHERNYNLDTSVPYDRNDVDLTEFRAKCDSLRLVQEKYLKTMQQKHPTLSQRYIDYIDGHYRVLQGRDMMQACYQSKDYSNLPPGYLEYVENEFWKNAPKPYTLYRDFTTMNADILYRIGRNVSDEKIADIFSQFEKEGKLVLSAEDKSVMEMLAAGENVPSSSETVASFNAFIQKYKHWINIYNCQQMLNMVDSIGCDQALRDIVIGRHYWQEIDHDREPVNATVMTFVEQEMQTPAIYAAVKALNDKYVAIQQSDI